MSIVTGRRIKYFYQKVSKSIKDKFEAIERELGNVLSSTEIDKHIFSDSKSGFVPKTVYTYDKEFRCLRADGEWVSPIEYYKDVLARRDVIYIDAQNATTTENIQLVGFTKGALLLISVFQVKVAGSLANAAKLLETYAYLAVIAEDETIVSGKGKEIVKIVALSSGLSSTYGTISGAVGEYGNEDFDYGTVKIKVNKGYAMTIKVIY